MSKIEIPEARKGKEKRDRRVTLCVPASLYTRMKEQADANGMNVNDWINAILELATAPDNEED